MKFYFWGGLYPAQALYEDEKKLPMEDGKKPRERQFKERSPFHGRLDGGCRREGRKNNMSSCGLTENSIRAALSGKWWQLLWQKLRDLLKSVRVNAALERCESLNVVILKSPDSVQTWVDDRSTCILKLYFIQVSLLNVSSFIFQSLHEWLRLRKMMVPCILLTFGRTWGFVNLW